MRQINKMRKDVAFSGGQEVAWDVRVDVRGQGRDAGFAGAERGKDHRLAGFAVRDQVLQPLAGVADCIAVAGQKTTPLHPGQTVQRGHICRHVAIGRCDD